MRLNTTLDEVTIKELLDSREKERRREDKKQKEDANFVLLTTNLECVRKTGMKPVFQ